MTEKPTHLRDAAHTTAGAGGAAGRRYIDPQELMTWANARLGKQQRIAGVQLLDNLPRNANGKILKRELRVQFKDVSYE